MKASDPASLDRLNDIVVPAPVSWWPLAPGWYVLFAILLTVGVWLAWKNWRTWKANAYRREAIHELESANTVGAISELLRRTALTTTSRSELATKTGDRWPDWLSQQFRNTTHPSISPTVREQLATAAYRDDTGQESLDELKAFAAAWIAQHSTNHAASADTNATSEERSC
ncbi:DUF4381 domain-containing protein [Rhodopirellula bahusiensis]|uniref:DUF4381 domain-containing protein n=1 Tax=Rhodopirellula bahusiensis TaxID=2014065 RepID=A0A2G1WB27_9BACT|nr:DUF4381 domain-containing protein [Rhodopirellula bahusiensis]PHQ36221.1 hypothetical protein CEE69_06060 [Rhodopirellula bahusiensis]